MISRDLDIRLHVCCFLNLPKEYSAASQEKLDTPPPDIGTPSAGRNLVLCFDGTNNQFGAQNTSVVRLVQVLDRDPARQRLYYDPGVGTLPEPGIATWLGKKVSDICGLAFGAGLGWKVQEGYAYLMDMWEPGDRIFLFGFSRGAYTARVLAGMLHALGLLPRGMNNLLPYAMRLYEGARNERVGANDQKWKTLCDQFRWTFSRTAYDGDDERRLPTHFLGLWDTVSSVGWVWEPERFPYTARNPSVQTARHAVSLDERRWFFRQNLLKMPEGNATASAHEQDLQERWFAGVHCDVGGGYPEIFSSHPQTTYSGIWREPFGWLLAEAMSRQLLVNSDRLETVLARQPECVSPWKEAQNESLTAAWWPLEYFPKRVWLSAEQRLAWRVGAGNRRDLIPGAAIHGSVLRRIRETGYAPKQFGARFLGKIRGLSAVPESLPFENDPPNG